MHSVHPVTDQQLIHQHQLQQETTDMEQASGMIHNELSNSSDYSKRHSFHPATDQQLIHQHQLQQETTDMEQASGMIHREPFNSSDYSKRHSFHPATHQQLAHQHQLHVQETHQQLSHQPLTLLSENNICVDNDIPIAFALPDNIQPTLPIGKARLSCPNINLSHVKKNELREEFMEEFKSAGADDYKLSGFLGTRAVQ